MIKNHSIILAIGLTAASLITPTIAMAQPKTAPFYKIKTWSNPIDGDDKNKPKTCKNGTISEDDIKKIKFRDGDFIFINQIPKEYNILQASGTWTPSWVGAEFYYADRNSRPIGQYPGEYPINFICIITNKIGDKFFVTYDSVSGYSYVYMGTIN